MHPHYIPPDLGWIQNINTVALAVGGLILVVLALLVKAVQKLSELIAAFGTMKRELDSVKKKATTAASTAQKIDESLHTNNSGSHVRDDMDKWAKSHATLDKKLDAVLEKVEHIDATQKSQADEARIDRSASELIHREIFRQVEELRSRQVNERPTDGNS